MLLWAVMSLFLVSVCLALVTQTYVRGAQAQRDSAGRLVALGVAEREMERLKVMPFASLPAGHSTPRWPGLDKLPNAQSSLDVAPAPQAGMRQITVRVTWRDGDGPERRVELVALRSPHGR